MPMISVIMPVYNAEKTIKESIDSVLTQTVDDLELIVVNDFSKDKSEEIIKEIAKLDSRIKYYKNSKNMGASESRNFAIGKATGKWIAFLDSDDIWKPEKLEKQLKVVKMNSDAQLVYTASAFINDDGDEFSYIMEAEEKTSYKDLLKKNLLSCSSVMISSDLMKELKMPGDHMHEDYYIWLKVLKKIGYAYGVNEPLLIYRLSLNSKSSNRIKSAKMTYQTYRCVGYNPATAFFLTFRYAFHSIRKRRSIKLSKK